MPFISRLKKLGTLPVPELQTTLAVYLINLEQSQYTNLVYTACDPIPADVSPPAHLRFDCPDGHTKRGDVLIWASRVRKKACFVHVCWIFNGTAWVKPDSDSEIMMDHPVYPDYQLVILSGPYVKWELKPDPDREPSLTIPDPPRVRPGARGTMNTIVTASPTPVRHSATELLEPQGDGSERPYDHTTESRTPDGSAALCGSRSSSPASDAIDDFFPKMQQSQTVTSPSGRSVHISDPSSSRRSQSPIAQQSNSLLRQEGNVTTPTTPCSRPESSNSVPGSSKLSAKRVRERPRGARSLPSAHPATPVTVAPPTPDSTKQTRSRVIRSRAASHASASSPRRLKRSRSGNVEYISSSQASITLNNEPSPSESPLPAAKKRRLDNDSRSHLTIKLRDSSKTSESKSSFLLEDDDDEEGLFLLEDDDDNDSDYSPPGGSKTRWDYPLDTRRPRGAQAAHRKGDSNSTAEVVDAKQRPQSTTQNSLLQDSETFRSGTNSFEDAGVETKGQIVDVSSNVQKAVSEAHQRDIDRAETAVHLVRQLQADVSRSEAALTESTRDSELKLAQLRSDRDKASHELEDLKIRAQQDMEAMRRETNDSALRYKKELQRARQVEESLTQARTAVTSELNSIRAERDALAKALQARTDSDLQQVRLLEETKGYLEEQRRRASSFEGSLRVAQEALQRQRTLAQEAEARQRSTIAQLAKEFQEKDQSAKKLAEEVETLAGRIGELKVSLSTSEHALVDEKDNVRRVKEEMERVKKATQEDRLEITRLKAARATDGQNLAAAKEEISGCRSQIDQLRQERTMNEAALVKEIHRRVELEKKAQDLQKSTVFLDHTRKVAEAHVLHERTAKQEVESRLKSHLAHFDEHLALTDKERGRLEELLLERRSSLQLDLRSKCRDLESMQAEYTKMKAERSSERERFLVELTSCRQRLTETANEQTQLQAHLLLKTQELEAAQVDCVSARSSLATERARFDSELSSLRTKSEHELSVCRQDLEGSVKERERIEVERAALEVTFREQTRSLMIKQAEYTHLKAHLSSERERLTAELSTTTQRFEGQLLDTRKQLDAMREEHKRVEQGFQVQRANFKLEAHQAAEALKLAHVKTSKQITILHAERERFESELASCRKQVSDFEKRLVTAQKECDEVGDILAKERAASTDERARYATDLINADQKIIDFEKRLVAAQKERAQVDEALTKEQDAFKDERERFASELCSIQIQLASLKTQLGDVENHRAQLEVLRAKERASFEEELTDLVVERSTAQKQLLSFEERLIEAETRRANLEETFAQERADLEVEAKVKAQELEGERAKCASASTELIDERQRLQDMSSSRATLEQELESCRSRLLLSEEKERCLEAKQADLQLQSSSASVKLEESQAECARLKAEISSQRERYDIERSLSPDGLRGKLASIEAYLDDERVATRTLREELAKEQSSNYWSDLGSQLLRSLHEVQDQLKVEQLSRQTLQDELALERSRNRGLESSLPSTVNIHTPELRI